MFCRWFPLLHRTFLFDVVSFIFLFTSLAWGGILYIYIYGIRLVKKFIQIFPYHLMEKIQVNFLANLIFTDKIVVKELLLRASRILRVSGLKFKYLIHFELIFIYCVR